AVIDDDDFEGKPFAGQRLTALPHEFGKVERLVFRRHEDAHVHRLGGSEGHTRFRIRAGRMPSWSRYFATVRRAIWMPCSWNRWTICWSVSGLAGPSSLTIFCNLARIDRALASSPEAVVSALEKKNLSGNTPRGVCTYFSLVTR